MSVLIKGLNKPQSCGDCWAEDWFCDRWRNRNWGMPPPDDCPIVAILAADVAPVIHSQWEYEEPNGANSFKGAYWCTNCHQPETFKRNFCPSCGAKMDGGQEE